MAEKLTSKQEISFDAAEKDTTRQPGKRGSQSRRGSRRGSSKSPRRESSSSYTRRGSSKILRRGPSKSDHKGKYKGDKRHSGVPSETEGKAEHDRSGSLFSKEQLVLPSWIEALDPTKTRQSVSESRPDTTGDQEGKEAEGGAGGDLTPVAEGDGTPVAEGGLTPVAEGDGTPVADGGLTPVAEGGLTPVAEGGGTPSREASGEEQGPVTGADSEIDPAKRVSSHPSGDDQAVEKSQSAQEQFSETELQEDGMSSVPVSEGDGEEAEREKSRGSSYTSPGSPSEEIEAAAESERSQSSASGSISPSESELEHIRARMNIFSENEIEEKKRRRRKLLAQYFGAMERRQEMLAENAALQRKILTHLKKNRRDDKYEHSRSLGDNEQRYVRFIAEVEQLNQQLTEDTALYHFDISDLKRQAMLQKEEASKQLQQFMDRTAQVSEGAVSYRTGKPIPPAVLEQRLAMDRKKDAEWSAIRLGNTKLRTKIMKAEEQLKAMDQLSKNLHLIDFEQLKLENESMGEKIAERNEELRKLRLKNSKQVNDSSHMKEKINYLAIHNATKNKVLNAVQDRLTDKRHQLGSLKKKRDLLRKENARLIKTNSLSCHPKLLRDFENKVDEKTEMTSHLMNLQNRHTQLLISSNHLRKKIEWKKRLEASTENTSESYDLGTIGPHKS